MNRRSRGWTVRRVVDSSALPARELVVTSAILARHAVERPAALCVIGPDGRRWTWAQALEQARRSAAALAGLGVRRGDHVLIFLPNGLDWLRAWWGVSSLGAVMVTVNVAFRGETLRHVCAESGASLIITDGELGERLEQLGLDHLTVVAPERLVDADGEPPELDPPLQPWDIHAVNFTSGTTGPAKGVLTPYLATYLGGVNAMGENGGLTSADRWLVDTPLFHVSGQMTALVCMSAGAEMAVRGQFAGTRYWQVAAEAGATHSLLVGTMAASCSHSHRRRPNGRTGCGWSCWRRWWPSPRRSGPGSGWRSCARSTGRPRSARRC